MPGAALLHPWPLAAAALILVNHLWLRRMHPGFWSGKLSDIGICFLLPIVIVATWEWFVVATRSLRGGGGDSPRAVPLAAVFVAGAYFTALKLWPVAGRWHAELVRSVAGSAQSITRDPSDLVCLVFTVMAYLYLCRWRRRRAQAPPAAATQGGL